VAVKTGEYNLDISALPSIDPKLEIRFSLAEISGKRVLMVGPHGGTESEGFRLIANIEGLNAFSKFEGFGQLALTEERVIGMVNSGVIVALQKKKGEARREKAFDESKGSVLVFSMLRKDINKAWRVPSTGGAPGGVVLGTSQANNPWLWLRISKVAGLASDEGEVSSANTDEFFSWVCSNTSAIFA
jgi:hypothetical protein